MINYHIIEKQILKSIDKSQRPSLLLHSCCAPCSSYCLEYLIDYFNITIFYYNPNITVENEYVKRLDEQKKYIKERYDEKIKIIEGAYEPQKFFETSKGLENLKEGDKRCFRCFMLRLDETARIAKKENFEYFCTTLSVSPYKNSDKLNEIGLQLEREYGVKYLVSDFKKNDGYHRSVELSRQYDLYRQNYCGCIYSFEERKASERREKE